MEALTDKLEQLESRIKELLGELKRIREDKEALEVKLFAHDQEMAALRAEISQLGQKKGETPERLEYIQRLEAEREQIRVKISEMLTELDKIKEME